MHVFKGFNFDLHPFFQYLFTFIAIVIVILQLLKNTASNYFTVDANFEEEEEEDQEAASLKKKKNMIGAVADSGDGAAVCVVCGGKGDKKCSGCKKVRYCSLSCQSKHWREGHKLKCQELKLSNRGKSSVCDSESSIKRPLLKKVLFPYEDFINLFNWEDNGCSPCGLLNCGNSCYANVVLQCLSCTRPLIAYLLKIGHARKCRRNDWCFLCELEAYVKRTRQNVRPFSPINILSRLPNIGGNLGYGKQEDAHEFMRFAIDTMQSVCLDEFGGEKSLHPTSQETTLIQYIFGGHLQSQVKCSKCNKISYRHENMMDLTVEIQGDAESLEECLDQFTAEEWLDGDNLYKCDGCNDYVKACKRLAVHHAPNILTIALKRFQSGRFGKLNKRVTSPETLDLGPYMSEPGNGTDIYRLYAVVVHIDMLNASYFGHYICYTKDYNGNWYRIDDCKVTNVDLDEVLAQGAYMLLYSRTSVRSSFVKLEETPQEKKQKVDEVEDAQPCLRGAVDSINAASMHSDVSSAAEIEQQGVDVVKKSQPYLLLPVEPIIFEGSTNSMSTVDPSPKEDDSVCMDLDVTLEVNPNCVREDVAVATDLSSAADMQEQRMDVGRMDPSSRGDESVCMNLDWPLDVSSENPKEDPAANAAVPGISKSSSLHMDLDCVDGINSMSTREEQLDHGLDNPDSSFSTMELDNCGYLYPDAIGASSSVEISHGELTLIPLTGSYSTVESGAHSDSHGYVNGNTITSVRESISSVLPLDDRFPSESDTRGLADISPGLLSDLYSAEKTLEKNSSLFHGVSDPKLEQVKAGESVKVIPTAITTGSILQAVDETCSSGNRGPLLCGFVNENGQCESTTNRKGDVMIQSDEVGSCNVTSKGNGFRAGFSPNVNVALDSNGMFPSNGHYTHNLLCESEKWLNKSEPGGDCSGVTSQMAEIAPLVKHASSVSASAPLIGTSFPTAAYDLGVSPKGYEYNIVPIGENGNRSSESVGSLSNSADNGMNATCSFVPVGTSSSDTEMLDSETDHVYGYRCREGGISVQSLSGPGISLTERTETFSSKSTSRVSTSFLSFSAGFLDKQKTPKFKNKTDAPEDPSGVKLPGNVNNGNKSTKHASVFQDSMHATNHDWNYNNGDVLESTHCIENQCDKKDGDELIEKTLGEAVEPQQNPCNRNKDEDERIDNGMNDTSSLGSDALSSSDAEMIDLETGAHVNGCQSREDGIPVQTLSGPGICSTGKTEAFPENLNNGKSTSRSSAPFLAVGFLDKQKTLKLQGNGNNGVKSTNHASVLKNSRQATDHDRNHSRGDLLESTRCSKNQCNQKDDGDEWIDKTPVGAVEPQQSHCNGNKDDDEKIDKTLSATGEPQQNRCNGNDHSSKVDIIKTVNKKQRSESFRRGFLNNPPQKTSMKKGRVDPGSSDG